jgi:hypothetical protein
VCKISSFPFVEETVFCPLCILFFFFGSPGVWIEGLTLATQALLPFEPLHQPFLVVGFFNIGSLELFVWGWLQTEILPNSAFWVARITGVSHWYLAPLYILSTLVPELFIVFHWFICLSLCQYHTILIFINIFWSQEVWLLLVSVPRLFWPFGVFCVSYKL